RCRALLGFTRRRAHPPRGVSRVVRHRRAAADDDRSASGAANDVRVVGGGGRDVHDVERGGGRGGGGEGKDNRMSSSKISEPEPLSIARRRVTLARVVRALGRFVRDWLPVFVVLFVYDAIHNRIGMIQPAHVMPQMRLEQALFGSPVPTVRMQAALYVPERPHWWDFATLVVYMSHFFVAAAIALALWIRSRTRYF